ncbi:hypothetical protein LG943_22145 [Streptomonospora sp. S1-112]|uniref:Uncharacterized protein n=1 Tax=Streptomonospora mangrovi TaxID=2883123 RepID=A0A9X3SR29_9ACTN|nr:hypothetical protein [Streptomonospora mangrovi]MDA0566996.1 hypothetical protein [Streptomonospora mangrovi]
MDSDLPLHDHVALAEIELYAEVLTAVAFAERRLTAEEIDLVLGVRRPVPEQTRRRVRERVGPRRR